MVKYFEVEEFLEEIKKYQVSDPIITVDNISNRLKNVKFVQEIEDSKVWFKIGHFFDHYGKFNTAKKCYEKTLSISPDFFNAWLALAIINHIIRNFDEETLMRKFIVN